MAKPQAESSKMASELSAANGSIASLTTELETVNASITTLTGQLTDAQTALATEQAAHQTDNTANEATINDLKAQILALTPVENPLQAPQS